MKTIILSDIQGKSKSVIPYGLRFGKHTGTEVEIVHAIDPRTAQGVSSPYANSQQITPGATLSHEEIMRRERSKAQMALEKFISSEGSRLNYPLKIDMKIKDGSVEEMMSEITSTYPGSIVIASNNPSNSVVEDMDEMLEIARSIELPTLFISPEYPFSVPKNTMLLTDFKHTDYETLKEMIHWLVPFHPNIHAYGLAGSKEHLDMDMESGAWKKMVNAFVDPPMIVEASVIDYGATLDVLLDSLNRNGAEMLLIPRYLLKASAGSPFSKKSFKKVLREVNIPVALF